MSATVLQFPQTSAATPSVPSGMSARRKAAIVLLSMPKDQAAAVLSELDDFEIEAMVVEIASVGVVSDEMSAAVLQEFAAAVASPGVTGMPGGIDTAHDLLAASVGQDRASEITERITGQLESSVPFAFLRDFDARQIAATLASEHPQTVALVLAHLPVELAASVLAGFDAGLIVRVAQRIAVMDRTSPEFIRVVEAGLKRDLYSSGISANELSTIGGVQPLVDIMNRTDRATERSLLEDLQGIDQELADSVRAQMFTFEDIAGLDDRAVQLVIRRVKIGDLALALKGVPDQVRAKFSRNMSERTTTMLEEETQALGMVRVSAVGAAQTQIIQELRELEEAGEVIIARSNMQEEFIA